MSPRNINLRNTDSDVGRMSIASNTPQDVSSLHSLVKAPGIGM